MHTGAWQGATRASKRCKRRWTMHVGLEEIAAPYSQMAFAICPTPSKHTPPTPSTATSSARPWPPAAVTFPALPPLPKLIPVCFFFFFPKKILLLLLLLLLLCVFIYFSFVFCDLGVGYGSCVYPSSLRYVPFPFLFLAIGSYETMRYIHKIYVGYSIWHRPFSFSLPFARISFFLFSVRKSFLHLQVKGSSFQFIFYLFFCGG